MAEFSSLKLVFLEAGWSIVASERAEICIGGLAQPLISASASSESPTRLADCGL